MNRTLLLILGACGLVLASAWYLVRPEGSMDSAATTTATTNSVSASSSAGNVSALPGLAPKALPVSIATGTRIVVPLKSALAIEFEKALALKPFYDRYMANPEGADAETKYFAAVAIETCVGRTRGAQGVTDADRERFQGRLKENDPNNQKRIEAFNRVTAMCDGFAGTNVTAADAARLYA